MGPIFNKKVAKNVICGTVNSARMHCSQLIKSTIAGWKKKKEKKMRKTLRRNADAGFIAIQIVTQCTRIGPKPNLGIWAHVPSILLETYYRKTTTTQKKKKN